MDDTSRTALSAGSLVSGSLRLPLPLALSRACDSRAFAWQPSGHQKTDCRMRREISLKPLLRSRWRSAPRWAYYRRERLGSAFCEKRGLCSSCGALIEHAQMFFCLPRVGPPVLVAVVGPGGRGGSREGQVGVAGARATGRGVWGHPPPTGVARESASLQPCGGTAPPGGHNTP